MNIRLLGQGFEALSKDSVGHQLIKFFADKHFHTFTGISAFASEAGVTGISKHIEPAKKHLDIITIVTGVDQKGTSKEALEALLSLNVNTFVFYHPAFPIFHPKIYLFEGKSKTELIIGSSNLTAQGLFNNVEASMLVSIDNNLAADRKIVEQLKDYFKGIFRNSDPNLKRLTPELITHLVNAKVVPTEEQRKAEHDKEKQTERTETDTIISKIFPKRTIARIPIEFRGRKKPKPKTETTTEVSPRGSGHYGNLVWTRKKLPASSVQQTPLGNDTGGLRLVQDGFEINGKKIISTEYFRHTLFSEFKWKEIRTSPFVEAAIIPFEVTIYGDFKGKYDLEVRHKPSGEAGQNNYTTSISWGAIGDIIKEANLTGSRLDLFEPRQKGLPFQIVIS